MYHYILILLHCYYNVWASFGSYTFNDFFNFFFICCNSSLGLVINAHANYGFESRKKPQGLVKVNEGATHI
jgi:hypothetical protein